MEALIGLGKLHEVSDLNDEGMELALKVNEIHREAEVGAVQEIREKILDAEP